MSESSEYLRIRAERKARAAVTIKANDKAAQAAKDARLGKNQPLPESNGTKAAKRAAWTRATTAPVTTPSTAPVVESPSPEGGAV